LSERWLGAWFLIFGFAGRLTFGPAEARTAAVGGPAAAAAAVAGGHEYPPKNRYSNPNDAVDLNREALNWGTGYLGDRMGNEEERMAKALGTNQPWCMAKSLYSVGERGVPKGRNYGSAFDLNDTSRDPPSDPPSRTLFAYPHSLRNLEILGASVCQIHTISPGFRISVYLFGPLASPKTGRKDPHGPNTKHPSTQAPPSTSAAFNIVRKTIFIIQSLSYILYVIRQ